MQDIRLKQTSGYIYSSLKSQNFFFHLFKVHLRKKYVSLFRMNSVWQISIKVLSVPIENLFCICVLM